MLIGALAEATGVSTKSLRFYEAEGLLSEPDRTPAGYRDYPDDAIDRVVFIQRAKSAGLTLAQIREILAIRDGGDPPCGHLASLVDQRLSQVEHRLRELHHTRDSLLALRDRLDSLDPADCDDGEICTAISSS